MLCLRWTCHRVGCRILASLNHRLDGALWAGLERLNLKGCDEVEGIFVIAAVRSLPRLEHLDATGCRRLSVLDAKELCTLICLNCSKRAISRKDAIPIQQTLYPTWRARFFGFF